MLKRLNVERNTKGIRVVFLLTQSLDSPSGLGRYFPLAKEMARLGDDMNIITLHHFWKSIQQKRLLIQGVKVWYVGQMHVKKVGNKKDYYNTVQLLWVVSVATIRLTYALFNIKPDVVYLGKPHPMNSIAALLYSKILRKPLYLDVDDYETDSNRFNGKWQRKIINWFENTIPRYARAITVNTFFSRDRLVEIGYPSQKIIFVPNGVDRERFVPIRNDELRKLQEIYGLIDKKVIVYVGSISLSSHDLDLLIYAFSKVVQVIDDVVLLLVGSGEDVLFVSHLLETIGISDKVIQVGRIAQAKVAAYYSIADVSIDPVRDSNVSRGRSPLKIFESLACGVPVITGDIGERRSILHSGRYGFLTDPGDVDDLARVIISVLSNMQELHKIHRRILMEIDKSDIYWDKLVQNFVEIYNI